MAGATRLARLARGRPFRNRPKSRAHEVELLDPPLADNGVRLLLDDVPLLVLERGEAVGEPEPVDDRLDRVLEQLERIRVAEPEAQLIRRLGGARPLAEGAGPRNDSVKGDVRREAALHPPGQPLGVKSSA
jgi:hypothetical protein